MRIDTERIDTDDLRLIVIAWARTRTDSGERSTLDEVAAEFGVDLDDGPGLDDDKEVPGGGECPPPGAS